MSTVIKDQNSADIEIPEIDCKGQSVTFQNLNNCKIIINGVLGAIYVYNCTHCKFQLTLVKSACNIYECENVQIDVVW